MAARENHGDHQPRTVVRFLELLSAFNIQTSEATAMSEIEKAAELVRELATTDAMFANFMADTSFDSPEEMQRFIRWFNEPGRIPSGWDVTRYARAQMALAYAALTAKLAEAEAELQRECEFSRTVLASLHWTGDGYEWTGGQFDYRMDPREAVNATVNELRRLRTENKEQRERLAYFDDPTPLTAEIVMEMLPANCNVGKPWESGDYAGLLTINWYESLKTQGTLWVSSTPLDISDLGTLGAFRRLATGLGIQLKEDGTC